MKEYYRVQADIDLDAICSNIEATRQIIKADTKIMAVIKADGYGHGAVPVARALGDRVDAYGVAILEEGISLRKAGFTKPVLILGCNPQQQIKGALEYDITQTVFQMETAKQIAKEALRQKKKAKIHIKIDTGMNRIGFYDTEEALEQIAEIYGMEGIETEGIFTHFACADEADKTSVQRQIKRFNDFILKLENKRIFIPVKHASNSAGIIDLPEVNLNMVRSGISTYGLYPSEEVKKERLCLKPAMEIKTEVSFIKEAGKGVGVSYGSTYITERPTKIATIPVGYADGYPRNLSSKGRVLIRQKSAPVIGRICMDQFMVDVTEIQGVQEGDAVTLLGRDGDECITVEELAKLAGSFNYELVCGISKRVPRVFYFRGKKAGTSDYYDCLNQTLDLEIE